MSKEQVSIVLETISFFLVTLDLYGKKRFLLLRKKIKDAQANKISVVVYSKAAPVTAIISILIFIFVFIFGIGALEVIYINDLNKHKALIVYISVAIICIVLYANMNSIAKSAILFSKKMIYAIVGLILFIMKAFPVEGMMITIGSFFFIVSKVLAYKATCV